MSLVLKCTDCLSQACAMMDMQFVATNVGYIFEVYNVIFYLHFHPLPHSTVLCCLYGSDVPLGEQLVVVIDFVFCALIGRFALTDVGSSV